MAVGLLGAVTDVLPGQEPRAVSARIEGTVFDSLGMRSLAGARVQLVSAGDRSRVRTVESDDAGGYAFDSVEPGDYLLGFLHPRLDSLGFAAPMAGVTVRDSGIVRTVLALPSVGTLVARACGSNFARDSLGLVLGTVRDARDGAPRSGVRVLARWRHLVIRGGRLREETDTATATTLDDGRYALCGIPAELTAVAVAGVGADSSGSFEVAMPAHGFAMRDVMIGRGTRGEAAGEPIFRGEGRVRGRVTREDGVGIAGAIARATRGNRVVRTDADGWFSLDSLPTGTQTLDLRAIGFHPGRVSVDVPGGEVAAPPVRLVATGVLIDTVKVLGLPDDPWLQRQGFFDRRRRAAGGHFLDEAQIERKNPLWVVDLLVQIPGVFVTPKLQGSGYSVTMRGGPALGSGSCTPELWVDGMRFGWVDDWRNVISGYDIRAMEVYTRPVHLPAEFMNLRGCGAIVIWTGPRKPLPPR